MITFSTPRARARSLPGLGLIQISASRAESILMGSTTTTLEPFWILAPRFSLLIPPEVWLLLQPHMTITSGVP